MLEGESPVIPYSDLFVWVRLPLAEFQEKLQIHLKIDGEELNVLSEKLLDDDQFLKKQKRQSRYMKASKR
jgi:hypothetical protein